MMMMMGKAIRFPFSMTATMNKRSIIIIMIMTRILTDAADTNVVFDPCSDSQVSKSDGFTFGLAFSTKESFFFNQTQLSPCDKRLPLAGSGAQLAIYRPKVDEISLLTVNGTAFDPTKYGGFAVAFAGRRYAARSLPAFVADNTHTLTSLTLVLEFQKGTLLNLYWKSFGCGSCPAGSVCLENQDCAMPSAKCTSHGGTEVCNLGIQLTFSGTDKNDDVLNSWYEVKNLRQYSLYGLYSDISKSIVG